jgi:hypothetical protein
MVIMHTLAFIECIIIVSLQLFDFWTTKTGITSGYGTEANPIVKKLMDLIGFIPGLFVFKMGVSIAISYVTFMGYADTQFGLSVFGMLTLFYAYITLNNYKIIKAARG